MAALRASKSAERPRSFRAHRASRVASIADAPRGVESSATAANWHIVHANAADATGFRHGGHAIAARLNHRAASRVTTRARDAHAVLGGLTFAHAHGHVTVTHHHSVHHCAATAHAAGHHRTKILQHRGRHRVVTFACHLHPAGTLLHLDFAPRNHHPLRGCRHTGCCAHRARGSVTHARHSHARSFHHNRTGHLVVLEGVWRFQTTDFLVVSSKLLSCIITSPISNSISNAMSISTRQRYHTWDGMNGTRINFRCGRMRPAISSKLVEIACSTSMIGHSG